MPIRDDDHTGTRIRDQRKLARLTQRQLADRCGYSFSLVNQVERGARPATMDFIAAAAHVLRVDVTTLTGQPYVTELQQDRLAALVRPIREALDLYDLGPDPDMPARPAEQLITAADDLCRMVRATRLRNAALMLPGLIAELTTAAWTQQTTDLWLALGSTYRTAHDISVKLGYFDLSSVALDRMEWAAARASDPLLAAVRQYMRALVYFREGDNSIGLRLVGSGHGILGQAPASRAATAVTGQLHLGASVIAARARDAGLVDSHLAEATACAEQVGEASDVHWLSFGPTNVSLHRMSASLEMRLYGQALAEAGNITIPAATPTSRRAHFLIDRARAEMETGRTDAALASLVDARRAAPEQTRYHPGARETISGLVHAARRTPETLTGMAAWIGL